MYRACSYPRYRANELGHVKLRRNFLCGLKPLPHSYRLPAPEADSREVMAAPRPDVTRTIPQEKRRFALQPRQEHPLWNHRGRCIRPPQPQIVDMNRSVRAVAGHPAAEATRLCFYAAENEN